MRKSRKSHSLGLARYAWAVLGVTLLVILWGAYVRASGSGAGCGSHWPLCNGEVVPRVASVKTAIEFSHRLSSGFVLILVVVLGGLTFFQIEKGSPVRRSAAWATVFIFSEALIGAGLVLFELVAHDASMKRALSMSVHLTNTLLLLGAIVLTAWQLASPDRKLARAAREGRRPILGAIVFALLALVLTATLGAIAALGDTLYPAQSLAQGFADDFSPAAHFLVRLRALHPAFAIASAIIVVGVCHYVASTRPTAKVRIWARVVIALYAAQIGLGFLNLFLRAPVAMQLIHLLVADVVWIAVVLLGLEALAANETDYEPMSDVPPSTRSAVPVLNAAETDTRNRTASPTS